MDISNKKVYFLGDSITNGGGASCVENNFVGRFQTKYPQAEIINYGIGGTRIAKQIKPSECDICDQDFVSRVDTMKEDADLVVIFGGTNDFGHGDAPFGDLQDKTNDTFCGAVYCLFEKVLTKYPNAQVLVLTPLHRLVEVNAKGKHLKEYVQVIKERAEYFAFPVLDLYAVSGINPCVANVQENMMPDGLHPNDRGYQRIFQLIDRYVASLL